MPPDLSAGYLVGAAVLIVDDQDRVLLGLRSKERVWASFGGRLEAAELAHVGAIREVYEETGLRLVSLTPLTFGEGTKADGTPFAVLYYTAALPAGQVPFIRELNLFAELGWFALDALPADMWPRERIVFKQLEKLVRAAKDKITVNT
jgi:ADP-ribose pyrophosphatase YjhB (NUDIX family)